MCRARSYQLAFKNNYQKHKRYIPTSYSRQMLKVVSGVGYRQQTIYLTCSSHCIKLAMVVHTQNPSHSGGRGRRIATSGSPFLCSKSLANLSYIKPCLRQTETKNKTQFLSIPMQSPQRNLHQQILFNLQMYSILLHSVCFNRGLQN